MQLDSKFLITGISPRYMCIYCISHDFVPSGASKIQAMNVANVDAASNNHLVVIFNHYN